MSIRRLVSFIVISMLLLTVSFALTRAQETACDTTANTFAQAEALSGQGDFAGAVTAYSCALQSRPDNPAILNGRGNAYRHLGNYTEAITDFNRAIELNASNANFFNNRGYVEYQQGELDKALEDFNYAITLDSNLAYAYNNRGLVYAKRGQVELAAADFRTAIALNIEPISWATKNLESLGMSAEVFPTMLPPPVVEADDLTQGQVAYRAEDYVTAIAAFSRAIANTPESAYLFCERAGAYYMSGDYENAIADYTRAIDLGHLPMHYVWRGNSYAHLGEFDKAFADYKSAIDYDPNYLNAYLYSATLHASQGERSLAHSDFKRWLDAMQSRIVKVDTPTNGENLKLDFKTGQEVYAITFTTHNDVAISAETSITSGDAVDPVLILSLDGIPWTVDDDSGTGLNPKIAGRSNPADATYTLYLMEQGTVGSVELSLVIGS